MTDEQLEKLNERRLEAKLKKEERKKRSIDEKIKKSNKLTVKEKEILNLIKESKMIDDKSQINITENAGIYSEETNEFVIAISKAIDNQIIEEMINLEKTTVLPIKEELVEVNQIKKQELSKNALGWKLYFERQKLDPEVFIKKYPTHKMKHYIDEVVEYINKNK